MIKLKLNWISVEERLPNGIDEDEDVFVAYSDDGAVGVEYYDSKTGWTGDRPVGFWHPLCESPYDGYFE